MLEEIKKNQEIQCLELADKLNKAQSWIDETVKQQEGRDIEFEKNRRSLCDMEIKVATTLGKLEQSQEEIGKISDKSSKDKQIYKLRLAELKYQNAGLKEIVSQLQSQIQSFNATSAAKDADFHSRIQELTR